MRNSLKDLLPFIFFSVYFFFGARHIIEGVSLSFVLLVFILLYIIFVNKILLFPYYLLFPFTCFIISIYINADNHLIYNIQNYIYPFFLFNIGIFLFYNCRSTYLIFVFLGVISNIFLIFQSLNFDFAWQIPSILQGEAFLEIESNASRFKPGGLSLYSVQYSYFGILVYFIISSLDYYGKNIWTIVSFILFFTSAILTQNLSLLLSLMTFILIKSNKKKYIFIFLLLISPLYLSRIVSPDSSMISRLYFAQVAYEILDNYPFGIPIDNLNYVKEDILLSSNVIEDEKVAILSTSFHNTFINTAIQLGILVGIFYVIWFFALTYKYSKNSKLNLAFFISYLFVSMFHNAGPLTQDGYFWLGIAFISSIFIKDRNENPSSL